MTKIEDLTIKQAKEKLKEYKEIQTLFNIKEDVQTLFNIKEDVIHQEAVSDIYSGYIGKYVICRTINEGVNAGYVVNLDSTGVILKDARRLYYHRPANKEMSWYEGVAESGISSDSQIGVPIEKIIIENYSLTLCSKEAENIITTAESHEQD